MPAKATAIFDGDDSRFQNAIHRMDRAMLAFQGRFASAMKFAAKVTAPVTIAAAALTAGLVAAIEKGRKYELMAEKTGVQAGQLYLIGKHFKAAGLEAEAAVPAIQKMLFSLQKGTADKIIERMGIKLSELKKKTPAEQFALLGKEIAKLPDYASKIEAARDIFGKTGAELLPVFNTRGFGDDRDKNTAAILNRDAGLFNDVSVKLHRAGVNVSSFFLGVADKVVPVLTPLLDRFEKMDLSRLGQQTGEAMTVAVATAANQGLVHTVLRNAAIVFGTLINEQLGLGMGYIAAGQRTLVEGAGEFLKLLRAAFSDSLLKGLSSSLLGIAHQFVSVLLNGMARLLDAAAHLPGLGRLKSVAGVVRQVGGEESSASRASFAGAADAFKKLGSDLFGDLMERVHRIEATASVAANRGRILTGPLGKLMDDVRSASIDAGNRMDAIRKKVLAEHPSQVGEGGESSAVNLSEHVSALGRIGGNFGGNGGDPLLQSALRRERLLEIISRNTGFKSNAPQGLALAGARYA